MKKALTLSLIIPVYNEQDYIVPCLEAVSKQTVKPIEVIVIDNNSSDKTVQLAQKYHFVTILHESKQGALYARTKGFNAAKGDIIGRIDADSRIEPNWVARAIEDFTKDDDLAAVTGSSHWYDMPFAPWNHWVEDFFKHTLWRYEKKFPFLFGTNMAIRKKSWHDVKSSLCIKDYIFEDADLAIHLYQSGHKLLYDIRLRAGMSARRGTDSFRGFLRYIRLQSITYKQHNIRTIGSIVSIAAYLMGYVVLRPFSLSYDVEQQRFSAKKLLLSPNKPRRHPFD